MGARCIEPELTTENRLRYASAETRPLGRVLLVVFAAAPSLTVGFLPRRSRNFLELFAGARVETENLSGGFKMNFKKLALILSTVVVCGMLAGGLVYAQE